MKILLAHPRGCCAGVNRAINIVEKALEIYGSPIYVKHELVHNSYVIDNLRNKGVIFIEEIQNIPSGSVLVFSAHGVSKNIRKEACNRKLKIFDASCPLVTKVHLEVARANRKGSEVIIIGHKNHPEIEGTIGQYDNINGGIYLIESLQDIDKLKIKNENDIYYMTQTTLSIEDTSNIIRELKHKFPKIQGPRKSDICYATTNRQEAINNLIEKVDLILIIGSKNSSNSNRLLELSKKSGKPSYLIDNYNYINISWFKNINIIGITSGASAPEILVQQVIKYLKTIFEIKYIKEIEGKIEKTIFNIPKELLVKSE